VPTDVSAPPTPLAVQVRLDYVLTPDSARVVYSDLGLAPRLFSAPLGGGSAIQLSTWLQNLHFELVPGGQRVLFTSLGQLSSVPVDGSQPAVQLATGVSSMLDVESTPDSTHVVFESSGLSVIPIDGSAPARLLTAASLWKFELAPDGEHAVFLDGSNRLRTVNVHGAPVVTTVSAPGMDCRSFVIGAASRRALVRSWVQAEDRDDLYVVDLSARRPPERISSQQAFDGVSQMWLTSDGQRALYLSNDEHLQGKELFGVLLPKAVRRR
jgi:hypothetical protein